MVGAEKDIQIDSLNANTLADGGTNLTGGVGVDVGDLTFDAELSVPLIAHGPYFISGAANDWTAELSLTYYFGKAK